MYNEEHDDAKSINSSIEVFWTCNEKRWMVTQGKIEG